MATCKLCSTSFKPKTGSTGQFCSKSCSATFNNKGRKHSQEAKNKIRKAANKARGPKHTGFCKIQYTTCKVCEKVFCQSIQTKRKTCSKVCQVTASTKQRSYQNGSRKPVYYFNPSTKSEVMLESSWEVKVAEYLDFHEIKWLRPEPLQWRDSLGKDRLYYPDFYVPEWGIYLDPKNPYCMEQDREKMQVMSYQINLVYGPLEVILDFIKTKGRTV